MDEPESTNQISLTRKIEVSVEDLFAAWTDPALLEQWQADYVETDFFEGGSFRYVSEGDEESPGEYVVSGTYITIEQDKKLIQAWTYETVEDGEEPIHSVLEVTFNAVGPRVTSITLVETSEAHEEPQSRIFSIEAWDAALKELAELLE